jgi:RNase H-fold protein (predicted Holliday junction resolvase)
VVDPSFAGNLEDQLAEAMEDELRRLGRSLLYIAQARARKQGVEAETVCISGPVWENIDSYLRKVDASALVIGLPKSAMTLDAFGSGEAQEVIQSLQKSTGIEIVVVN